MFRNEVLDFFHENGRDLPWRRTRDPYAVLVSEVMLQQTQVSRVLPYYAAFMNGFPNVQVLANVELGKVIRTWQGLGYNRRAVNLQRAARMVVDRFNGVFPESLLELEQLPGVGRYTARAVACFAFGAPVALVETNIRRALMSFAERCDAPAGFDLEALAELFLPADDPWTWNQAIMDFGAMAVSSVRSDRKNAALPTTAFEETDRFWRGRIVAALCRYPDTMPVQQLLRELPAQYEEGRVRSLLRDLAQEGLVSLAQDGEAVALPE